MIMVFSTLAIILIQGTQPIRTLLQKVLALEFVSILLRTSVYHLRFNPFNPEFKFGMYIFYILIHFYMTHQ